MAFPRRSLASVTTRFKVMVKEPVRFSGCYESAVQSKPSSTDDDILVSTATSLSSGSRWPYPLVIMVRASAS